jgi:hypothetical protein
MDNNFVHAILLISAIQIYAFNAKNLVKVEIFFIKKPSSPSSHSLITAPSPSCSKIMDWATTIIRI